MKSIIAFPYSYTIIAAYSDYPAEVAMYEMLAWLEEMDSVTAGISPSITQHTYSRGFITERVLFDFWSGLSRFLSAEASAVMTSCDMLDSIRTTAPSGRLPAVGSQQGRQDHTDEFIAALHGLDDYTRAASYATATPVKEMYKEWFFKGKELVDWWTTLVR